jgi:hypothetical protein
MHLLGSQARRLDVLALSAAILPLLLTRHIPLNDYPELLAQDYVMRHWAESPALRDYYGWHVSLTPNMILPLFSLGCHAVAPFITVGMAGRLFCVATVCLLFFGVRALSRAAMPAGGTGAWLYRFVPLLIYGGPLQFGFLNYCFGTGAALLASAWYLRGREAPLPRLLALFLPVSLVLLLSHLFAFGFFAIAIFCAELDAALRQPGTPAKRLAALIRQGVRALAFLAPPYLLFALASPALRQGGATGLVWSSLTQKLEGVAAITMFASPYAELLLLGVAALGLATALASGCVRLTRQGCYVAASFTLLWLVLPRSGLGSGHVDYRVPWAGALFLLAYLVPRPRLAWRAQALARALAGLFAILAGLRIGLIAGMWLAWEPAIAAIDQAFLGLPVGSRLMVATGSSPSATALRMPPLDHVAAYAIIRRQVLEPNFFASFAGQLFDYQPNYLRLRHWDVLRDPSAPLDPSWQYLLILHPAGDPLPPGTDPVPVARGAYFRLFRMRDRA